MKRIYLITHGTKFGGHNQDMTPDGLKQIISIREQLLPKMPWIPVIFVGIGARHKQTFHVLIPTMPHTQIRHSPFCGTADEIEDCEDAVDTNCGKVRTSEYLGLVNTPGFNPWEFASSLPQDALLCAGKELMTALGLSNIFSDGQLYELDANTKTGKLFKA